MCDKCGGYVAFSGKVAQMQTCYCVNCGYVMAFRSGRQVEDLYKNL